MVLNDNTIVTLSPELMLSKAFLYSLLEVEEPEEQSRYEALAEVHAKELGIEQQFKKALKAYHKADADLAAEYKQQNAQKTNIDLDFDGNGKPICSIDNFLQVLEHDPKFKGLKFNLLTYAPEQERGGKTFKWTDADDSETRRYIEKKYKFHSKDKCDDALRIVFANHEYHPIRDIINAIEWDGVERVCDFLHRWTKCEDNAYTREVSRLIFSGGIHRLYNPGCKFDDMPVLIGAKQGEGKSTLVRWLAMEDEFFTEVNEFDGPRGMEALDGAWICEVGELLALTKTQEQEAVKAFLTRMNDRRRLPFDRRVTDHQRQCIFIGTTNKRQFLTDKTGNRRFYPVEVHTSGYDLFDHKEEIQAYIKQCWAEALHKLRAGVMEPYADRSLVSVIREKQSEAVEDDYRVGMIADYLSDKTEVCALELWYNALNMSQFSKPSKKESNEIGLIMQSVDGWVRQPKVKRFPDFGVQRWWKKMGENDEETMLPL